MPPVTTAAAMQTNKKHVPAVHEPGRLLVVNAGDGVDQEAEPFRHLRHVLHRLA